MSDTPRTDAEVAGIGWFVTDSDNRAYFSTDYECLTDFARQLERELSAARAEVERVRKAAIESMRIERKRGRDLEKRNEELTALLRRLVAVVPEPELVYSYDEPPQHRTMEDHELGYALHLARAALGEDKP